MAPQPCILGPRAGSQTPPHLLASGMAPTPFSAHTEGFCFLHAASSRGSGAARPCQQHAAQVKGNRAALCSQKGPAPLCVPVLAGARGTWPRDTASPPAPATSITFWMPLINHSSLSGQGEWELRPARPRPRLPPPGLFPFSRALPAAFCPLNGRGAKPDGWIEAGK